MNKEDLIALKKKLLKLSENEAIERNLYLKKFYNGELQGPLTGFPAVDKPWVKYFSDEQIRIKSVNKTAYRFMYDENLDYSNDVSIIFLGKKIKYSELFERIEDAAKSLKSLGVNKGDVVTICMPNTPESAYLFYACSKIGAIADFIDPRESEEGLLKYLNISNAKTLVTMDMCIPNFKNLIEKKGIKNVVTVSPIESLPKIINGTINLKESLINHQNIKTTKNIKREWKKIANVYNYSEFIQEGKKFNGQTETMYEPNRPVAIVHTGGTTGVPKGVLLSNDNLNELTNQLIHSDMPFKRHYLSFGVMPEFVGYGLSVGLHTSLVMGMQDMMIPKYEPEKIPKMILKYKPNVLTGSPAHWEIFSKSPLINKKNVDLSFFKSPCEGGDTLNTKIENRVNELLTEHGCNTKIQKGYGMTEKSSAATVTFRNDLNPIGSVGAPLIKTDLCIYDEEQGELGFNEVGEICVKAPDVMLEYYNNPEETDKVLKVHPEGDTWLHSGDLGYIDKDGLLYVVGRIKDIIIRYDGIKIYPHNVETQLLNNPLIKTIAIIGIDDPEHDNGEIPVAFVTLEQDMNNEEVINQIKQYAVDKLTDYLVPIDYVIIDSLPKTKVGKVDKKKLKEMYKETKKEKTLKKKLSRK